VIFKPGYSAFFAAEVITTEKEMTSGLSEVAAKLRPNRTSVKRTSSKPLYPHNIMIKPGWNTKG